MFLQQGWPPTPYAEHTDGSDFHSSISRQWPWSPNTPGFAHTCLDVSLVSLFQGSVARRGKYEHTHLSLVPFVDETISVHQIFHFTLLQLVWTIWLFGANYYHQVEMAKTRNVSTIPVFSCNDNSPAATDLRMAGLQVGGRMPVLYPTLKEQETNVCCDKPLRRGSL